MTLVRLAICQTKPPEDNQLGRRRPPLLLTRLKRLLVFSLAGRDRPEERREPWPQRTGTSPI